MRANLIFFLPLWVFLQVSCGERPAMDFSKGGMVFTIAVDAQDFLYKVSGQTGNKKFETALQRAHTDHRIHSREFIRAFAGHYTKMNSAAGLVAAFNYGDPKKFTLKMSEQEVVEKLLEEYGKRVDAVQDLLDKRLRQLVDRADYHLYQEGSKMIKLEVAGKYDYDRIRKLVNTPVGMGFYETYNNSEMMQGIQALDSLTAREKYPELNAAEDNPLYENKKHPLFDLLQLAITQQGPEQYYYWEKGCRIGLAKMNDTAAINQMLHSKTAKEIFPADLHFVWSQWPETIEKDEFFSLYLVKAVNMEQAVIDGSVVVEAQVDEDRGRIAISMGMNEQGTEQWSRLTEMNVGKSIAIVMDGKVISAPIVEGIIPNGRAIINGVFTYEEANDLALMLKSGGAFTKFGLVDEKEMKGSK